MYLLASVDVPYANFNSTICSTAKSVSMCAGRSTLDYQCVRAHAHAHKSIHIFNALQHCPYLPAILNLQRKKWQPGTDIGGSKGEHLGMPFGWA